MPVIRVKSVANIKQEDDTCNTNIRGTNLGPSEGLSEARPGNSKCPRETVKPRRSARLASKYKYTVPSDKPIVASKWLLEGGSPRFETFEPVRQEDLSKQPAWPESDSQTTAHSNRRLKREQSFILVDCGAHFEMVDPKAIHYFARVPQGFGTMAPYHRFDQNLSDEELGKKLGARLVRDYSDASAARAQKTGGSGQTRKRRRLEEVEEEDSAATGSKRPVKKARVTKARPRKN